MKLKSGVISGGENINPEGPEEHMDKKIFRVIKTDIKNLRLTADKDNRFM